MKETFVNAALHILHFSPSSSSSWYSLLSVSLYRFRGGRQAGGCSFVVVVFLKDRQTRSIDENICPNHAGISSTSSSTSSCFLYSTASKWCLRAVCNGAGARQSWWEKRETPPPLTTVYSPSLLNCHAMTWVVVVAAAVSSCRRVESRSG